MRFRHLAISRQYSTISFVLFRLVVYAFQISWFMIRDLPNKTVQAAPMNAAVSSLRSKAGLCHRYGVPDLFR